MSGAVTELVAIGVQDTYLTGNPQMSFFRQAYKRHTNFALESVRQIFKGQPAPNGMSSVTLKRAGDLVNGMYLLMDDPSDLESPAMINYMVDRFELYIGGQKIDQYAGSSSNMFDTTATVPKSLTGGIPASDSLAFCPLHFFCCQDANSPLPLVALQYHDVEVRIYWNANATGAAGNEAQKLAFYANYAYLDTQERNVFAQNKQELLITQHQEITWTSSDASPQSIIDLPFSHPVKVLYIQNAEGEDGTTEPVAPTFNTARLTLELNGQQRFEPQVSTYFQSIQPYYYGSPHGWFGAIGGGNPPAAIYSFALDYGQTQPCGTLNFSRIDNARWHVTTGTMVGDSPSLTTLRGSAINYNILKCENGMGGLLFAN